jgi:hypothetical protein
MKLLRKIKKLLRMDNVEWVENTEKKYPLMESDEYLLVQTGGEDPMLFTKYTVKEGQKQAGKHPEDVY